MRLIERYLFRQLLGVSLATLAALVAVAILTQSLTLFDVLVEQRQSAGVFGQLVLLGLPPLISMLTPIAFFVGALLAYNRLHTEHEIVVCFAAGVTRWRVIAPAMRLATFAALATLTINLFVQPLAQRESRRLAFEVRTDLAAMLVREGEFVRPGKGLTVYAQDVDPDGTIRNLFLHQEKPDGSTTTISAREGRVAQPAGHPVLVLREGSNHELDSQNVLNFLAFDEYLFDLRPFVKADEQIFYKVSDRFLHELVFPDMRHQWEQLNRDKMLAEANGRVAGPLYAFAFVAMALAAVLGGPFSRAGYGQRIAVVSLGAGVLRITGFGVQAMCEDAAWLNIFQYALPVGATWYSIKVITRARMAHEAGMVSLAGPPRAGRAELSPL